MRKILSVVLLAVALAACSAQKPGVPAVAGGTADANPSSGIDSGN